LKNTATPHYTSALKVEHIWGSDGGNNRVPGLTEAIGFPRAHPRRGEEHNNGTAAAPGAKPEEHNNGTTAAPGARTPRADGEPRH